MRCAFFDVSRTGHTFLLVRDTTRRTFVFVRDYPAAGLFWRERANFLCVEILPLAGTTSVTVPDSGERPTYH